MFGFFVVKDKGVMLHSICIFSIIDVCHNIGCLDPENFKEFKLVKRTELSHNVAKFRFSLPTPTSVLGLPIGQHMSCRFLFAWFCLLLAHIIKQSLCVVYFSMRSRTKVMRVY